ncbi:hypothetical protein K435DRAFT_868641 [Dendrothele bispora CBS 962.96]|uniref:Uncharacterized protein n=1 Tax=Dendrothele bispora (strain CBS 962.96) TaxID=1314807 RepID=A0A4S8LBC4_DENBC|nr:hypothetical protein K435DRAFT_868641 [Dendrothele bispora CBS 962.96]
MAKSKDKKPNKEPAKRGAPSQFDARRENWLQTKFSEYLGVDERTEKTKWLNRVVNEWFEAFPYHCDEEPEEFRVIMYLEKKSSQTKSQPRSSPPQTSTSAIPNGTPTSEIPSVAHSSASGSQLDLSSSAKTATIPQSGDDTTGDASATIPPSGDNTTGDASAPQGDASGGVGDSSSPGTAFPSTGMQSTVCTAEDNEEKFEGILRELSEEALEGLKKRCQETRSEYSQNAAYRKTIRSWFGMERLRVHSASGARNPFKNWFDQIKKMDPGPPRRSTRVRPTPSNVKTFVQLLPEGWITDTVVEALKRLPDTEVKKVLAQLQTAADTKNAVEFNRAVVDFTIKYPSYMEDAMIVDQARRKSADQMDVENDMDSDTVKGGTSDQSSDAGERAIEALRQFADPSSSIGIPEVEGKLGLILGENFTEEWRKAIKTVECQDPDDKGGIDHLEALIPSLQVSAQSQSSSGRVVSVPSTPTPGSNVVSTSVPSTPTPASKLDHRVHTLSPPGSTRVSLVPTSPTAPETRSSSPPHTPSPPVSTRVSLPSVPTTPTAPGSHPISSSPPALPVTSTIDAENLVNDNQISLGNSESGYQSENAMDLGPGSNDFCFDRTDWPAWMHSAGDFLEIKLHDMEKIGDKDTCRTLLREWSIFERWHSFDNPKNACYSFVGRPAAVGVWFKSGKKFRDFSPKESKDGEVDTIYTSFPTWWSTINPDWRPHDALRRHTDYFTITLCGRAPRPGEKKFDLAVYSSGTTVPKNGQKGLKFHEFRPEEFKTKVLHYFMDFLLETTDEDSVPNEGLNHDLTTDTDTGGNESNDLPNKATDSEASGATTASRAKSGGKVTNTKKKKSLDGDGEKKGESKGSKSKGVQGKDSKGKGKGKGRGSEKRKKGKVDEEEETITSDSDSSDVPTSQDPGPPRRSTRVRPTPSNVKTFVQLLPEGWITDTVVEALKRLPETEVKKVLGQLQTAANTKSAVEFNRAVVDFTHQYPSYMEDAMIVDQARKKSADQMDAEMENDIGLDPVKGGTSDQSSNVSERAIEALRKFADPSSSMGIPEVEEKLESILGENFTEEWRKAIKTVESQDPDDRGGMDRLETLIPLLQDSAQSQSSGPVSTGISSVPSTPTPTPGSEVDHQVNTPSPPVSTQVSLPSVPTTPTTPTAPETHAVSPSSPHTPSPAHAVSTRVSLVPSVPTTPTAPETLSLSSPAMPVAISTINAENAVGNNQISLGNSELSESAMDTSPGNEDFGFDRTDWPAWMHSAGDFLEKKLHDMEEFGDKETCRTLLREWSIFERWHSFDNPKNACYSSVGRPTAVGVWFKNGKKFRDFSPKESKDGEVDTIYTSFPTWWLTINPDWRPRDKENNIILGNEEKGDWSALDKHGPCGLLTVIMLLIWWAKSNSDKSLWSDTVRDVVVTLRGLNHGNRTHGVRRKRADDDEGEPAELKRRATRSNVT